MARILVVGCGDLGAEVIRLLVDADHEVVGVRASDKPLPNGVPHLQTDVTDVSSLKDLQHIAPNIVIYCISADAQTDTSYKAHYVDGLKNILATQTQNSQLQHVFFVSSTRVYGQGTTELLNENTAALPNDYGGKRLLEAETLLKHLPCKSTAIRLSGLYGPGRLYLINMAKDLSRWPDSNRWTNRIHRDDAARFIVFLCNKVAAAEFVDDCYIGTDDMPALLYEILTWMTKMLNIEPLKVKVSETIVGKRLSNQRMRKSGFALRYPDYKAGYSEVLKGLYNKND